MRIHLFEWLDQPWFPSTLRDAMRRYLATSYRATPLPALWAQPLARLLRDTGETTIVDLGSGAAGPIHLVLEELRREQLTPQVTLTDLFPMDVPAVDGTAASQVRTWPEPVDALAVPPTLRGVRTMFAVLHHLEPAAAAGVLRNAFEERQAIAIFEGTARTPVTLLLSLLFPVLVLVLTPRVRPLTAAQLVFTYLVPILPLLIFWDGLVSHLRTYSLDELSALTADLQASDYEWTIGTLAARGVPFEVPYLIGRRSEARGRRSEAG